MKKSWIYEIGSLKTLGKAFSLVLALALLGALPARSANVLFVVGSITPLGAGDLAVQTLLGTTLKHTVTTKVANTTTAGDATGKALVLVSSTVPSADVAAKFRDVAVPVLSWEGFIYDDMGMTSTAATSFGSDAAFSTVTIATPSHAIAAGLTGSPAFYNPSTTGNTWGIPGSGAVKIATLPTDANKALVFAFDAGAPLVTGPNIPVNAPARRVGFSLGDITYNSLTPGGKAMFLAAVNWAMNITPVTITAPPSNQSVQVGQSAIFSVQAAGSPTLTLQWTRNGANISGATSASYTTPPTTVADNGAVFAAVVTNPGGSVTSPNAILTVTTGPVAPTITNPAADPAAQTATVGGIYSFTVAATGSPAPAFNATGLPPGLAINSTTGAITGTPTAAGPFTATVTAFNTVLPNATRTINYTVNQAPAITFPPTSPTAININTGVPLNYAVVATGTPTPTFSAPGLPAGLSINSTTGLITGTPTTAGTATVTVTASNGIGSNATRTLNFTVTFVPTPPSITTQPAPAKVQLGATATFTVVAAGTSLTYQWKRHGNNVTTGTGGTTASYTTAATTAADDDFQYTCTISNSLGTISTDGASKLRVETRAGMLAANDVAASRITASELVTTPQWEIPDYVFEKGYSLRTLPELEKYLETHKHLPEVPSAAEIRGRGMDMGKMNVTLLKNLEELTLHVISLQKEMKAKDLRMEKQLDSLRTLLKSR